MKPAISIIIPHYNHAKELPRLLKSLCAQQMTDMEVIVVDDCSDTPCDCVVDAFAAKGLDVRLLKSRERVFTKNARLLGMRDARADIIAFADCDDEFINPPSLHEHVREFRATGADLLHFHVHTTDCNDNFIPGVRIGAPLAERLEGRDIFARLVACNFGFPVWGKLYARDLCLRVADAAWDIPIMRYAEDTCLSSLLFFHARRYVGSAATGYHHRYVDKRNAESAERAWYKYLMLTRVVPYLAENGCPEPLLQNFARLMRQKLCLHAGRFCKAASTDDAFLTDKELDSLLNLTDERTWLRILILGNGMNAKKLVRITRTALDFDR
jgi:glycosyltransferase involved in cell wall biosynthesis